MELKPFQLREPRQSTDIGEVVFSEFEPFQLREHRQGTHIGEFDVLDFSNLTFTQSAFVSSQVGFLAASLNRRFCLGE